MKLFYILILLFLACFIGYPLCLLFWKSANVSIHLFPLVAGNYLVRQSLTNSFLLAFLVTAAATIISFPLGILLSFYRFPARSAWDKILLLPLVAPPFVSALGMRQVLSRFGPLNLILMKTGTIHFPIDFLGSGLPGIFLLQVLHLYPILLLNIRASLEEFDFSCAEASFNLGAGFFTTFRKIIFPMVLPGYFAGAFLVFIWSLTDLGTPLVFDYSSLMPVQIFQSITDINTNPNGYVLSILISFISLLFFAAGSRYISKKHFIGVSRFRTEREYKTLPPKIKLTAVFLLSVLVLVSLFPHVSVIFNSLSDHWFFTVFPDKLNFHFYRMIFGHPVAGRSILNSLLYSAAASILTGILGVSAGYIISRTGFRLKQTLETFILIPMVIPGIVFAFSFIPAFSGTFLDPRVFPVTLLVICYTLRRLPFAVRAVVANFQVLSPSYEESSLNLGADKWQTFKNITFPLLKNGIYAGLILTFAFSVMEVSGSLLLVFREEYFPLAKGIYQLSGRVTDGPYIASALGVLGMLLITAGIFISGRLVSKRQTSFYQY